MARSMSRSARAVVVWWSVASCTLQSEPAPRPGMGNPDAGEGLRAKKEEGKVGKREARADEPASVGGLAGGGDGVGGGGTTGGLGGMGTVGKGYGSGTEAGERKSTESYADAGVNGFVQASTDRVSTFSIDVDTGSYTISRRKLVEGQLPPTAAVRVEEFVNYFAYDYAPPSDGALFRVHAEVAPHPFTPDHRILRVAVKGREVPTTRSAPVHLTFLVDTSGSMRSADKLPLAQQALHYLVDNLGPEDTVAIATYAGETRKVLDPTPASRARAVHDAIDSLRSGGGTAMESGMAVAYEMAKAAFVGGAENRVLVLSDGDANIGPSTHQEILETIARYAGQGITLSTIGFGMGNYKDDTMERLADKGDGNYAYVDSMSEAKKVFGTDLAGTIRTIARDVKIQVDFDPAHVRSYRLVGYENRDIADQDFRDDQVDAGEIGSGHQVTALYELELATTSPGTLATVRLRAKPPGADAAATEWAVPVSSVGPATFDAASDDLRLAFGVATFAELLRRSPHTTGIRYDDALRIVSRATDPERPDHTELIRLIERARALSGEALANAR